MLEQLLSRFPPIKLGCGLGSCLVWDEMFLLEKENLFFGGGGGKGLLLFLSINLFLFHKCILHYYRCCTARVYQKRGAQCINFVIIIDFSSC